jgi:hypothetical protein
MRNLMDADLELLPGPGPVPVPVPVTEKDFMLRFSILLQIVLVRN